MGWRGQISEKGHARICLHSNELRENIIEPPFCHDPMTAKLFVRRREGFFPSFAPDSSRVILAFRIPELGSRRLKYARRFVSIVLCPAGWPRGKTGFQTVLVLVIWETMTLKL